ncbi:MAG: ROK family protein, partial [Thermoguttaceae bacterium]|nr:ROK family protein [Thermoguttaceae bacterium]
MSETTVKKTTILALDLGGSKMLSALVDVFESADGERSTKLRGVARRALAKDAGRDGVWAAILDATAETFERTGESWDAVASIGATIPGVADPSRGFWVYAPFSGIADFPLADELRARFGKPVFADNDVNACAWAEKVFGACQGVDNFVWITISNGIGGGLVLDGKVYAGKFSGAAEIGHFNVVENGALCGCGNRGCLEATAAGPGIARRYRELVKDVGGGN